MQIMEGETAPEADFIFAWQAIPDLLSLERWWCLWNKVQKTRWFLQRWRKCLLHAGDLGWREGYTAEKCFFWRPQEEELNRFFRDAEIVTCKCSVGWVWKQENFDFYVEFDLLHRSKYSWWCYCDGCGRVLRMCLAPSLGCFMGCTWQLGLPFTGNWETMRVENPARRGIIHRQCLQVWE